MVASWREKMAISLGVIALPLPIIAERGFLLHLERDHALPAQFGLDEIGIVAAALAFDAIALLIGAFPGKDVEFECFFRHGLVLGHAVDFFKAGHALFHFTQAGEA